MNLALQFTVYTIEHELFADCERKIPTIWKYGDGGKYIQQQLQKSEI